VRPTDAPQNVVRRWVDAVNERDIGALLDVADDEIVCRPLSIAGGGGTFTGHEGLRRWIGRLSAVETDLHARCDEIRPLGGNLVAAFGELCVNDRVLSPWTLVASVRDGKISAAQSFFSDERTMKETGLLGGE
jgi:hypothetical protein